MNSSLTDKPKDHANEPVYWFVILVKALENGRISEAAAAQTELDRLGFAILTTPPKPEPDQLPKLLTPQDVALWLRLPTGRVLRMARNGLIPSFMLPCGELMFDANELRKWSEQLKSSSSNGQQSPNTKLKEAS